VLLSHGSVSSLWFSLHHRHHLPSSTSSEKE
jgi:hypothetical protein